MKVRMKSTAAGPGIYHMKGSIVDVPEAQANLYVKGGYAEYVDAPPVKDETPPESPEEEPRDDGESEPEPEPEPAPAKKTSKKKA